MKTSVVAAILLATLAAAIVMGITMQDTPAKGDGKNPIVLIETDKGKIRVELFEDKAPITVKNFLDYVDKKHYDGTIFHRVIKDFMIQGGGFDANMKEKGTGPQIKNESNNMLSNKRGTIAMARLPQPDTATAQFFINVVDNKNLDRNQEKAAAYTVFGQVIEGMNVVDAIRAVATDTKGMHEDVPVTPIVIRSIRVEGK